MIPRIPVRWHTPVRPMPLHSRRIYVISYSLPAVLETMEYGPGIVYYDRQMMCPVLAQFPALDAAHVALALGWTP